MKNCNDVIALIFNGRLFQRVGQPSGMPYLLQSLAGWIVSLLSATFWMSDRVVSNLIVKWE